MDNFAYYCPTRIVFGRDTMGELKTLVPASARIMVTYGGGSVLRNGVMDQVLEALDGREIVQFGGIEPNPLYETLMPGAERIRGEGIEFLLAVGGGSVLDGTKFMAAASRYEDGDPWQLLVHRNEISVQAAVPLGTVLTLPATGSESNAFAVISRQSTHEKLAFASEHVIPRFSILDPTATFSLPASQVRNGIVDSFIHTLEQYVTYPCDAPLQDRQAEAILLTLLEEGPKTLAAPTDYASRANFMWCATQALNGLINCGVPRDFATHLIGHELTAFYGLAHAESLAVVLTKLYRHQKKNKREKLLQYARRVWAIQDHDEECAIDEALGKTDAFFHSLGMPTTLADYRIDPRDAAQRVQERFSKRGTLLGERQNIDAKAAADILGTY